jgi:demethylmenaquinone methyltransferase/2-methoxy-6-polyprenyl-1,4-benzoquinol methylase
MFGRVAPRYDLLNHLLSANVDRHWRTRTVRRVSDVLSRPGALSLDLCCGTGDLMFALQKVAAGRVLGSDFCHPMLVAARAKRPCDVFESDALRLPVCDRSLDLVTVAFGFRNLANYRCGLEEMLRVLKPGGAAAILEFSQPPNRAFAALYNFYSRHVLPVIGGMLSGSRDAYTYLPESVRKFPSAPELAEQMRAAGFREVEYELMTGGIVALHIGRNLAFSALAQCGLKLLPRVRRADEQLLSRAGAQCDRFPAVSRGHGDAHLHFAFRVANRPNHTGNHRPHS